MEILKSPETSGDFILGIFVKVISFPKKSDAIQDNLHYLLKYWTLFYMSNDSYFNFTANWTFRVFKKS